MYSDSDDDSQISQPHLADRPRLLDQTMEKEFTLSTDNTELVTSASASENLNRLVQSLSGASLTESLDSVSIGTRNERDDDKNRSPINRPQSMLTKMNKQQQYPSMETKFEDKALQTSPITSLSCLPHLIDQIEAHSSPSSSPRPFISRHLQNWADADLPQTENQYQARTQVKNRSFWARSRLQFQADEELFYKIKVLFPTLTKERIHELLYLHNNQEHEVIADAINCLKPKQVHYNPRLHRELFAEFVSDEHFERLRSVDDHCARQENSVAIIKLRYLLYLYPDADLLRTYDLLHNLDYKADLVAEELEKLGLKRADRRDAVTSPEMNSGKQHHSQSSMSHWNVMACDENFALPMPIHEQERRYGCLQNEHPDVDEQLIRMALKCSEFEMDQARQLLHMVNLHPQPNFIEQVPITSTRTSGMIYMTTRGTQTGYLIHYDFDRSQIYTKNKSRMLCKDVAVQTLVSSDHSSQFPSKSTISTGPIASNRMGPTVRAKGSSGLAQGHAFFHRAGALLSNAIGPNPKLVNGSNNALIAGNKDRHQPIGPNRSIRVGPIGPESIQVVEQELRIN